jgi:hypothetical protein
MPHPQDHDPPQDQPDDRLDEDELLDTGQEEVFSRTEVELGRIEHASGAGKADPPRPKPAG